MNELKTLESLGLELPGPWYIVGSILFSIVGYVVYRRGKNSAQTALKWIGVALMLYPYAISDTLLLYLCGAALCGAAWYYRQ